MKIGGISRWFAQDCARIVGWDSVKWIRHWIYQWMISFLLSVSIQPNQPLSEQLIGNAVDQVLPLIVYCAMRITKGEDCSRSSESKAKRRHFWTAIRLTRRNTELSLQIFLKKVWLFCQIRFGRDRVPLVFQSPLLSFPVCPACMAASIFACRYFFDWLLFSSGGGTAEPGLRVTTCESEQNRTKDKKKSSFLHGFRVWRVDWSNEMVNSKY